MGNTPYPERSEGSGAHLPWYVYIVSNKKRALYVGITTDPIRRLREHITGKYMNAFTRRYNFDRIVYYESHPSEAVAKILNELNS